MRRLIAVIAGLAVLAAVNWTIVQRERLLVSGAVVRLELAPIDPRSLMQGDYMALRFAIANRMAAAGEPAPASDGAIVVSADARGVAQFVRRDTGEPLAAGEQRLRYRVRDGQVKFATNAWFFQEGHADRYVRAHYGEFRVAPSGEMLLTHMLDDKLTRLGQPAD